MENVRKWLMNNFDCGNGSGFGSGSGDVYGNVRGSGSGSGAGYEDGSGFGSGFGSGSGDVYGNVRGSGYGSGSGYGYGNVRGAGYGYGTGIEEFEGKQVFAVDNVQTIITHIKDSFAKGFILESDFSLTPCYIVKGNGYFAHGETLKEASAELQSKIFANMDVDEVIDKFMDVFKKGKKYPGTKFFEWHHYLTGSCLMGRESFVKNRNLNLEDEFTVDEFIEICENDYGSEVIQQLKEQWNERS